MKWYAHSLLVASFLLAAAHTSSVRAQTFPPPVSFASAPGAAIFSQGTAGVGPFVNVIGDLPLHAGGSGDSWWFSGYFVAQGQQISYIYHVLLVPSPAGALLVQSTTFTNSTTGAYYSDSQEYPLSQATVSTTELNIVTPTSSLHGTFDDMTVVANTPGGSLNLHLRAASPGLFNGGTGTFPFLGGATSEYAVPLLATMGSITVASKTYSVQGTSWFDRQWGTTATGSVAALKWIWLGINLSNGEALSVWSFFDQAIGKNRQFATVLHADGSDSVEAAEVSASTTARWQSPATGQTYPVSWTIRIPQLNTLLTITGNPVNQEIVIPGLGGSYEGVSNVTGIYKGCPAAGVGRIELKGPWN